MEICRKYKWQFMIVLKDDSLPCVWKEFNALKSFDDNRNNRHSRKWCNRRKRFIWVNDNCHVYDQMRKGEIVHVVVCEEEWKRLVKMLESSLNTKSLHGSQVSLQADGIYIKDVTWMEDPAE